MRILHVALGLPPLRTGGLTRYCTELMQAQAKCGDEVVLLYPGRFLPGRMRTLSSLWKEIATYEIINPLPVALTYGIGDPVPFFAPCRNLSAYETLLQKINPDVVHVHCFQGVHLEFFETVKRRGIPIVYTTHDYYPICPRCTLINSEGSECSDGPSPKECCACNFRRGMSYRNSLVMQSQTYARLKETKIVKCLGSIAKREISSSNGRSDSRVEPSPKSILAYDQLLTYNRSIFSLFDTVISNSRLSEKVYRQTFPDVDYRLLSISHAGLRRAASNLKPMPKNRPTRIAYLGGDRTYKGFDTLAGAVRILFKRGIAMDVSLYGDDFAGPFDIPGARVRGRVAPDAVNAILRHHDVVVVPSKCHETFGFIVLEALCEGTPVICSDVVGASTLVDQNSVFRAGDEVSLADVIERLLQHDFVSISIPSDYPLSMNDQTLRLRSIYEDVSKGA